MGEGENEETGKGKSHQKRISFVEDGSLDGSDEDGGAVEVTFEPGNPYRRKSSLVSSEINIPTVHRIPARQRAECIVHQLLEEQKRKDAAASSPIRGSAQFRAHPIYTNTSHHETAVDGARVSQQNSVVEPKGQHHRHDHSRVMFEPENSDSADGGQADQKAWAREMAKSASELDLSHHHHQEQQNHDNIHSRMLTKKQLSDMAWGVRELSRRLSSMRIKFRAKSIFILTKIHDSDLINKTRDLTQWLLDKEREVKYVVYVEKKLKTNKKFDASKLVDDLARDHSKDGGKRLRYWDEDMCRTRPHSFDFVITLGGDGTVLYASWLFQRIVPPVLSFALGSLGFLTKFDFEDYKLTLNSAFSKGVTVSLRLRFECTVMRSVRRKNESLEKGSEEDDQELHRKRDLVEELIGEESEDAHTHRPDGTYEILNEVVVDRGPNPTMSYTEVFGDDEHFTSVLADGICVSTPTGSTAYNLAAGGSLCHPENPVMLVTSICAHTLSFRPIILPDTIVLRVGVPYDARTASWASFDGRERVELQGGDYVTISASRYPFASVQAEGRRSEDWVNSISGKLGWNTRQKQKGHILLPPPDLFDQTTIISLLSTLAIVFAAYATSLKALPRSSPTNTASGGTIRFLFIWHLSDALCHFALEGSFLYHCFFSYVPAREAVDVANLFPTPYNFLGWEDQRIYGPQSGGGNPFAQLWMVYARADKRWAGVDLGVVSLELLTVFFDGPLACYICYLLAKQNPKASIWMIVLATAELYGGFMTFCPEWLTGNINLDGSNFMYMWVYLVFFNMLWVFIPLYTVYYAVNDISNAFAVRQAKKNL
ncbi:NAD(+) kinase [Cladobotryum mycophilum]|uniref:NAD(+) kinase n=1 Tax=Cladobotryum mycophilum TaxID=491253 RepID=A0ABR0SMI1_9HYPO